MTPAHDTNDNMLVDLDKLLCADGISKAHVFGNTNVKVVPALGALSTCIVPPCFSMISLTKERPKPCPFTS